MKWKSKKTALKPRLGEERVVEKFFWYPICLDDEWRWMTKCKVVQRICQIDVGGSMEWGNYAYRWCCVHWVD